MFSSQVLTEYTNGTRDTTAANIANGKIKLNYYYQQLLAEADNYTTEKTRYLSAKAGQRGYLFPPDYIKIKAIRMYAAPAWFPVDEESGLDRWQARIAYPRTNTFAEKFHITNESGNLHFELDPIPSTDVLNGIEITYEGYQDPLYFPSDISTTVTVTQGSNQISSNTGLFTSDMVSRFLQVQNGKYAYDILSYTSSNAIALVNYFQENTNSSAVVTIGEGLRLPFEYHLSPAWMAIADYYLPINWRKQQDFVMRYQADLASLHKKYQNKSKGQVTPGVPVSPGSAGAPRNYPYKLLTNRP